MVVSAAFAVVMAVALQGGTAMASWRPNDPDIQGIVKMSPNFGGAWFIGESLSNGIHALIIGIFVSIFVSAEFNFGTMKNIVSKGFNRTKVYAAKFVICASAALLMLIVYMVAGCLAGTILWGFDPNGIASLGGMITLFLNQALLMIAYTAVFVFVATSLRSNGASIGVNICVVMLVATLLQAINLLFGGSVNLSDFWISGNISKLATLSPAGSDVLRGIIVAVVYTAAATLAGSALFEKQDIK
jgi:ABC-2 type transport system permease protein